MEKDSFQYQLYMLGDENEINVLIKNERGEKDE